MSEDHYDDEHEHSGGGSRHPMAERFRGYLPVVIDVETGGFNCATDALLEIAATTIGMDEQGFVFPEHTHFFRVEPFEGANIEAAALEFTGIKLDHPLRMAVSEEAALTDIFRGVRKALKANGCKRAILVGHNSSFDLGFLNAAVTRLDMKRNPFHPFSSFDTATLAGLAYGQTVLAKACQAAGIDFDGREAHSARYDTEKTAELFCGIVNRWKQMGGWEDFHGFPRKKKPAISGRFFLLRTWLTACQRSRSGKPQRLLAKRSCLCRLFSSWQGRLRRALRGIAGRQPDGSALPCYGPAAGR